MVFLFTNSYKIKIIIVAIAVHGISLFLFTGMWDSLILKNAFDTKNFSIVHSWFKQSGVPLIGYLHSFLGSYSFYPILYKSLTLLMLTFIALLVFKIISYLKIFSEFEAFVVAVITIIYPVYSLWFDLVLFPLTVAYVFYLGGLYIYLFFERSLVRFPVSLLLLFLAFQIPSFLVFHYGIMAGLFLTTFNTKDNVGINTVNFLKKHWIILGFPVIAFLLKNLLFPTYGEYKEYNKIDINPMKIAEGLIAGISNITFGQGPLLKDILIYFPVLLSFMALFSFIIYKSEINAYEVNKNKGILILFSLVLLMSSLLPYAMVYKVPTVAGYATRHALLTSLPLGLFIVGILSLINIRFVKPMILILLIVFSCLQIKNKILWENRYVKYAAVADYFSTQPTKPNLKAVLFDDRTHIGIKVRLTFYECNWILKQAMENETNLGMDKTSFQDMQKLSDKTGSEKIKYMMSSVTRVSDPPLMLKIDAKSKISNFAFFYNCKIKSLPANEYFTFAWVQ